MAKKTEKNPLAIVLPIILAVAGVGAGVAVIIAKKKKKKAIAAPPVTYPPDMIPEYAPPPERKPSAAEKWQQTAKAMTEAREAQKVLEQASAAAKFFTPRTQTPQMQTQALPPEEAMPPITKEEAAAWEKDPLGMEKMAKEMEKDLAKEKPKEKPKPKPKVKAKPADAAKQAAGPLSIVTTVGKAAFTGVSAVAKGVASAVSFAAPVLIPLAIAAVVLGGIEACAKMKRQYHKMHKDYSHWRALAVDFCNTTKFIDGNISRLENAKKQMLRDIDNCKSLLKTLS